jgi:hypothetical protein
MRTSRVVFAGIAVAAAAATTSAFTASNTYDQVAKDNDVAGYGEIGVSGATVTDVAYHAYDGDNTYLDHVVFTLSTDVRTQKATMTLKHTATTNPSASATVSLPYDCTPSATFTTTMTETCSVALSDGNGGTTRPTFESFDSVGLTVVHPAA